ncbi:MAG: alpha/beta fold hydrolase [Fimbriimonas sp.]
MHAFIVALALVPTPVSGPSFDVKVTGQGRPILLIPGLTCPGSVWDETVAHLKNRYECHVFTLPGFAGRPAIGDPFLPRVRDEIIRYVADKRLKQPAVIGHSLGGFMAYYVASTAPKSFGPIVAVDGVPWLAALGNPKAKVEEIRKQVEPGIKTMAGVSQEDFRAQTMIALKSQMHDPKRAEAVAKEACESKPAAVAQAMLEMMTTDLRPDVAKIEAPILQFAAGEWAKTDAQKEQARKMYGAQIEGARNGRLEMAWNARHFVMFDDFAFFSRTVDAFLESAWPR